MDALATTIDTTGLRGHRDHNSIDSHVISLVDLPTADKTTKVYNSHRQEDGA